ncbi:MAG: hypothetical protein ACYDDF_10010 [Thermoplasmatota archaeon]
MLPDEAFDRAERRLGKVIGMDVDEKGSPKNYVILLDGEAARTVLGGVERGLLVVPAAEAFLWPKNLEAHDGPALLGKRAPLIPSDTQPEAGDDAQRILILKSNMDKLGRLTRSSRSPADELDPSAW